MRNIAEIITFHTPIDDEKISRENSEKILDMTEDFLKNSGENFVKNYENLPNYSVTHFTIENIANIKIFIKKSEFFALFPEPFVICKIFLNTNMLQKNIIENFLDTMIRFFSGPYKNAYFLDYDVDFTLSPMNIWKKISIDEIKNLDIKNQNFDEKKRFLDGIFALRYNLFKEKFKLENAENPEISDENFLYLNQVLKASKIRQDLNYKAILEQIEMIDSQIKIILNYLTPTLS